MEFLRFHHSYCFYPHHKMSNLILNCLDSNRIIVDFPRLQWYNQGLGFTIKIYLNELPITNHIIINVFPKFQL